MSLGIGVCCKAKTIRTDEGRRLGLEIFKAVSNWAAERECTVLSNFGTRQPAHLTKSVYDASDIGR